ncbi:hypothetical protein SAMN04487996_10430 [Dyadobacter soli]|uniref:BppU N-terminal domain-containing protein n=1 Tax=Dyadobacter soli TaxID=659014 RepID=A0A1G7B288_9BACT|nr:hypothetical protein [Dyadobacter soli]SDE20376.1 hypothetical protein SAMN04487996_10430 [Dyadobacter soli]
MPTSTTGPATGLDINVYRGDTMERFIQIKRNGVEEQLSDHQFRMQVRSASVVIIELTTDPNGGITFEQTPGGVLALVIDAAKMSTLNPGTYQFDMQQTYAVTGKVKTRFRGTCTITDDVTKPLS